MNSSLRNWLAATLVLPLAVCAFEAPAADAPRGGAVLAAVPSVVGCAELKAVALADLGGEGSRVVSASEEERNGVAVCRVEGLLAPSIGFRITLPVKSWTQRYLQIGCGGLCGSIPGMIGAAENCAPLAAGGFVQGATDMGHQGNSSEFGRDTQKRIDFAYRAQHLTTLAAKKLIQAYYGRPQTRAYFSGCSDGGREALMEAQRYPEDFDGIIAGAAAMSFTTQNGLYHAWQARTNTGQDGSAILLASRLPLLHQAVLDQCDALDGQKDGLLSEPRLCHFDPASIQCAAGQTDRSHCLSTAEVEAVRRLYAGPVDVASGEKLTPGGPLPGSELNWAGVFVPVAADQPIFSTMIAEGALRDLLFEPSLPASFKLADLAFTKASFEALLRTHALYDATNPDLDRFVKAGHKLILWHGLADPHITPLTSIAYHEALQKRFGEGGARGFERLYLLPGVSHCSGGEGPSAIDLLTPMLDWVENGIAPEAILASQADPNKRNAFGQAGGGGPEGGKPKGVLPGAEGSRPQGPPPGVMALPLAHSLVQSRPVYPYPQLARYRGRGDAMRAESQEAGPALTGEATPAWVGSAYFSVESFKAAKP